MKYFVTAKIEGTAWTEVEANSEEEALELCHSEEWTIDNWDLNTQSYSGGYLEVEEVEE